MTNLLSPPPQRTRIKICGLNLLDFRASHRAAGEFLGSLRTALDQPHGAAQ